MSHSSNGSEVDDNDSYYPRFLLPPYVRGAEELEEYAPGGFHPVHLGDTFDGGRYVIVHKLGAGGFATVWLAQDKIEKTWVALKIVRAKESIRVGLKNCPVLQATSSGSSKQLIVSTEIRRFFFKGPNGRHLCLVLPVLGPSASRLSSHLEVRLESWLARKAAYHATKAVAAMHAQGLCHGDITTANIVFTLDTDKLGDDWVYRFFAPPFTGALETESGEPAGPEAPRYIVEALDFLSSTSMNVISDNVTLIDFDQSFPTSSPPQKILGTPHEYMAPEVAVGLPASPASDVWALGCSIFRLRSGVGAFEGFEVTSPADLMRIVVQTLGDMPSEWQDTLWDYWGQPTKDPKKGEVLWKYETPRSLRDLVYRIWDRPEGDVVKTGITDREPSELTNDNKPFPPHFDHMVWKPAAVRIDNVFLPIGYNDETYELLKAMPKIPESEAELLYDLLAKIFVYEAAKRPTAEELLQHPWFHLDGQLD